MFLAKAGRISTDTLPTGERLDIHYSASRSRPRPRSDPAIGWRCGDAPDIRIANLMGSHGSKAVAMGVLGRCHGLMLEPTVIDVSEGEPNATSEGFAGRIQSQGQMEFWSCGVGRLLPIVRRCRRQCEVREGAGCCGLCPPEL